MRKGRTFLLAGILLAALHGGVEGGEPTVRFVRKKLKSETMETVWYRYKQKDATPGYELQEYTQNRFTFAIQAAY